MWRGKVYQWHVQIRRLGHPTQTKTFNTKIDAEAWARMIESEMDRGVFLNRPEAERVTIAEWVGRYLVEVTPSKKNLREETRLLGKIKEEFAPYYLSALQAKHVAAWRDSMAAAGRAGSIINHPVHRDRYRHQQRGSTFRTTLSFTRLTAAEALKQLHSQGVAEELLPSPSTMAEVLDRNGFRLRSMVKATLPRRGWR